MNDIQFFKKYQKQLVWFINTKIGRWFFKVEEEIQNICAVYPQALTFDMHYERQKNGTWKKVEKTCYSTNNLYAYLLNYRLRYLHKITLLIPSLARPELSPFLVPVMLTVDTYYPAAGENSPVDGSVRRYYSSQDTFSNMRSGNGTHFDNSGVYLNAFLVSGSTSDKFNNFYRAITLFDTSDIGTDDIDSASLSVYGGFKYNELGSVDLHVCQSNPPSTSTLAASDFEGMVGYNTSFGSIAYADYSTTGYNDISLNASGIANISKTGISKFGLKFSWDINNSFTGTWGAGKMSGYQMLSADDTSGTKDPKLTVTHSAVATFIPQIIFS